MKTPLAIYYATMTGNAESLARQAYNRAISAGLAATLHDLANVKPAELLAHASHPNAVSLFVVSTWGDGEPPADACDFHYELRKVPIGLSGLRHVVFGLGDSDYPNFNSFARELDERLMELGSQALMPRVEADLDFDDVFPDWLEEFLTAVMESAVIS